MEDYVLQASAAQPADAAAHIFNAGGRWAMLTVESGRLYAPDEGLLDPLREAMAVGDEARLRMLMTAVGVAAPENLGGSIPSSVPVRSFSLTIAAKCNLVCAYCYAEGGNFGGADKSMSLDVALRAVKSLIDDAATGEHVRLIFMGGEPLTNRSGLREATKFAAGYAASKGVTVDFSLTTNATLLTEDDADFLDEYRFAVTVSIDGIGATHDKARPDRGGHGTYERVIGRLRHLVERRQRRCHIAARVSVTPNNLELPEILTGLADLGFDRIQFAPVIASPSGSCSLDTKELDLMLAQMIACSERFEALLAEGKTLPFANLIETLARIHKGSRDEYPCGAGGSYLGVSTDGGLYACHRFVNDDDARMGDIDVGLNQNSQADWLARRNVQFQEPCKSCWARHLCGGGCHYDVINRGRLFCDYIRGWLDHCLGVYVRLASERPHQLASILGVEVASEARRDVLPPN